MKASSPELENIASHDVVMMQGNDIVAIAYWGTYDDCQKWFKRHPVGSWRRDTNYGIRHIDSGKLMSHMIYF